MEKKMFGIILTVLGIIGLIVAAINFAGKSSMGTRTTIIYLVLGIIFFFSGIGLLKTTKDTSA